MSSFHGYSGMKLGGSAMSSVGYMSTYSFGACRGSCGALKAMYMKNGLSLALAMSK